MAKEAKLALQPRTELGSRPCTRLRRRGLIPGNMYGHKQDPTPVTADLAQFSALIHSGVRVFDVEVAGKLEKAILREAQWDALGTDLTHFDLLRVDPNERVTVHVPLELKGTAAGVLRGGMLEQPIHTLTIECLTYQIPDSITIRVSNLDIGQSIHLRDLELPEGAKCDLSPDAVILHIIQVQTKEPVAGEPGAAEPEVIGKKPAEAGADDKKETKKK